MNNNDKVEEYSPDELEFMQNGDIFVLKHRLIADLYKSFERLRSVIQQVPVTGFQGIFNNMEYKGKISKGDNYLFMPYLVLDCPAVFKPDGVLAIRTMFWWGHGFSVTLHINGSFLQSYRNSLLKNVDKMKDMDGYFSSGERQWDHHYLEDNYLPLSELSAGLLKQNMDKGFLKLSVRMPVTEYKNLNSWVIENINRYAALFN